MEILKIIIWLGIFLVFYSYIGYALLIWVYLRMKRIFRKSAAPRDPDFEPPVSLIIASYNEEDVIQAKIENCLAINYPADKLKIIFAADGSTDRTPEIIRQYPRVTLLYTPERKGKLAAINRAMETVDTPFVVFCDANTFLNENCIREIVKHYQDEKTGAVAGEKKVMAADGAGGGEIGEGFYWKYESRLKKIDSDFYSVVGAAGELFSIRTALYEPQEPHILLDDFIISMRICQKGYRVVYEPLAFAKEAPSLTLEDEKNRKIRISAGAFQSMLMLKSLLNIFKYGKLSFLYISHRVSRWVFCPVLLPLIFVCSAFVFYYQGGTVYTILFAAQVVFYCMALLGWILSARKIKISLFYIPYYFVFMNLNLYAGFIKFLRGRQSVIWVKARRK